jgi:predicted NBD/HSP70 family sugar kinase
MLRHAPTVQRDIANSLNLSSTTVSKIVTTLKQIGLFTEDQAESHGARGHPVVPMRWSRSLLVLGVTINDRDNLPESLLGVVTTIDGVVLGSESCQLDRCWGEDGFDRLVVTIAALAHRLRESFVGPNQNVIGLGVDVGGHVEGGNIRFSVNTGLGSRGRLDGSYLPLQRRLIETLGIPTFVENDVNALANSILLLGNRTTKAHSAQPPTDIDLTDEELDDFILITVLDDGVGGGVIIDGRLRRGANGMAGEVGHIPAALGYGKKADVGHGSEPRKCRCGRSDCLEAYCSPSAILHILQCTTLADAITLSSSHPAAVDAFTSAGRALGTTIAGMINFLNPRAFLVYLPYELLRASIDNAGGHFLPSMWQAIHEHCFSDAAARTRVAVRFSSQREQRHWCALAAAQLVVERFVQGDL